MFCSIFSFYEHHCCHSDRHIVQRNTVQWLCCRFNSSATHHFNLRAVGQLLNGVDVLGIELQQNRHLEGGRLKRTTNTNICILYEYIARPKCYMSQRESWFKKKKNSRRIPQLWFHNYELICSKIGPCIQTGLRNPFFTVKMKYPQTFFGFYHLFILYEF